MPKRGNLTTGFTLLELAVSLMLTSGLVLVMYSSLRITLKAMTRSQSTAEHFQEIRVGQSILERSINATVSGSAGKRLYFLGTPKEVRFFTLVPLEAYNSGGVYHWRLLVGQDERGQKVLAVEQTRNVNWQRDPEGVEVRLIVVRNIISANFSYGRGGLETTTWDAEADGILPSWVKIKINMMGQGSLVFLISIPVAENMDAANR